MIILTTEEVNEYVGKVSSNRERKNRMENDQYLSHEKKLKYFDT